MGVLGVLRWEGTEERGCKIHFPVRWAGDRPVVEKLGTATGAWRLASKSKITEEGCRFSYIVSCWSVAASSFLLLSPFPVVRVRKTLYSRVIITFNGHSRVYMRIHAKFLYKYH